MVKLFMRYRELLFLRSANLKLKSFPSDIWFISYDCLHASQDLHFTTTYTTNIYAGVASWPTRRLFTLVGAVAVRVDLTMAKYGVSSTFLFNLDFIKKTASRENKELWIILSYGTCTQSYKMYLKAWRNKVTLSNYLLKREKFEAAQGCSATDVLILRKWVFQERQKSNEMWPWQN